MRTRHLFLNILTAILLFFSSSVLYAQEPKIDSIICKGRNIEIYTQDLKASRKALGGNIFLGKIKYSGNLSRFFKDPFIIGINLDFHRNKWVWQIDDYLGFGKTKEKMIFTENDIWDKDKSVYSVMLGGNLGYTLYDTRNIKFVPLAGINIQMLGSTFMSTSDIAEYEPVLPYFKMGFYIDFKSLVLLQNHIRINHEDENYTSLRLSMGINLPLSKGNYEEYFHVPMLYLTLGMGGLSRAYK